jgi:hypothetical protein
MSLVAWGALNRLVQRVGRTGPGRTGRRPALSALVAVVAVVVLDEALKRGLSVRCPAQEGVLRRLDVGVEASQPPSARGGDLDELADCGGRDRLSA